MTDKTVISRNGGRFYSHDRSVYREPVEIVYSDDTVGVQMGFKICECDEYVDGAVEHIVKALNTYQESE